MYIVSLHVLTVGLRQFKQIKSMHAAFAISLTGRSVAFRNTFASLHSLSDPNKLCLFRFPNSVARHSELETQSKFCAG